MNPESLFLGRGWAFPCEFDRNRKQVNMSEADQDIEESLVILLNTSPGERVMHPDYGCGLRSMVFENITNSDKTIIKDLIKKAVLYHESRIRLDNIFIDDSDLFSFGNILITLEYTIRSTNTRSNFVFPFYINEGTNVRL